MQQVIYQRRMMDLDGNCRAGYHSTAGPPVFDSRLAVREVGLQLDSFFFLPPNTKSCKNSAKIIIFSHAKTGAVV
jgi:hypothetical protein